jgi:hypothetical protein
MHRAFAPNLLRHALRTLFAAPPSVHRLPPTRAARPARSRGIFFAGGWHSRLGRWARHAGCIALATLVLATSAHFAVPAFNAAATNGNAGPELLASATRTPSFLTARAH